MEYRLRPCVSWSFLPNNNHQAVKKMESLVTTNTLIIHIYIYIYLFVCVYFI